MASFAAKANRKWATLTGLYNVDFVYLPFFKFHFSVSLDLVSKRHSTLTFVEQAMF